MGDAYQLSHGFTVDNTISPKRNFAQYLKNNPTDPSVLTRPTKKQIHNLCNKPDAVPTEILEVLNHGLGHVIATKRKRDENPIDFDRLRRNIRIKYMDLPPKAYNPRLYVPKTEWEPDTAPEEVEDAISTFEEATDRIFYTHRNVPDRFNVSKHQIDVMKSFKKERRFIATDSDKGLGATVLELEQATRKANQEHLNNRNNYEKLSPEEAAAQNQTNFDQICAHFTDNTELPTEERDFFRNKLWGKRDSNDIMHPKEDLELPYFYILPKLHKTPWKSRPVESGVNSIIEPLSIWIDNKLQQVIHLCPACLKDSWHFLNIIQNARRMEPDTVLLTCDAKAMYANIPTQHALEVFAKWFELHKKDLPLDYPVDLILKGLEIVMKQNVFMFGNCFYKQLNGTAMGTSCACACAWATTCYSCHEETMILLMEIVRLYGRLIDDSFTGLKNIRGSYNEFMTAMNSFGPKGSRLVWETEHIGPEVVFLDLRIRLNWRGQFVTSTHQKEMNLHLYRKESSAQPSHAHYGLIFGSMHRFFWQNTYIQDFLRLVEATMGRIFARDHDLHTMVQRFRRAAERISDSKQPIPKLRPTNHTEDKVKDAIIIHLPYHPQDPRRRDIQKLFQECLLPALTAHPEGELKRAIIACSNLPTVGSYVKKNRLEAHIDTNTREREQAQIPKSLPNPAL